MPRTPILQPVEPPAAEEPAQTGVGTSAEPGIPTADPFAPPEGRIAAVADRLGVTEGQLYSMVIGVLLAWAVSANALPSVLWDRVQAAGVPVAAPLTPAQPPAQQVPELPPVAVAEPAPAVPLAAFPEPMPAPVAEPVPAPLAPPPAEPAPAPVAPAPTSAGDSGPLRVVSGGYASAGAGTPLATFGVPAGSVAVARRAASDFNIAYLRLAGTGGTLELQVDRAGTNTGDALAALTLCVVVPEQWKVGQGDVSLEEAPAVDCTQPVDGIRDDVDDRWTFDVSSLNLPAGAGVAVMPAGDAVPPDFQVVFSLSQASPTPTPTRTGSSR